MALFFVRILGIFAIAGIVILLFRFHATGVPAQVVVLSENRPVSTVNTEPVAATTTQTITEDVLEAPVTRDREISSVPPTKPITETSLQTEIPDKPVVSTESSSDIINVERLEKPYSTSPFETEHVNLMTREALVNILCETSAGSFQPISGSGTIIDPRGVILTNAHVAQYLLLSTRPELRISCTIRTGSPARPKYRASILYMPESWVTDHAADIRSARPMGTGENDFALLLITESTNASPLPSSFPYLPYDSRETIGFPGDTVVVAAYPAEFSGGISTQMNLYASSAVTRIRELLTFTDRPVDVLSLGGIILAQSGSSGGAVANTWGKLIGVVTTTSPGATTGERDLRAITLSHIDRALYQEAGVGLATMLTGNLVERNIKFMNTAAPALAQTIINEL